MTPDDIRANLAVMGVDASTVQLDIWVGFCEEMKDRQYGHEETLDALHFYSFGFRDGFKCGLRECE